MLPDGTVVPPATINDHTVVLWAMFDIPVPEIHTILQPTAVSVNAVMRTILFSGNLFVFLLWEFFHVTMFRCMSRTTVKQHLITNRNETAVNGALRADSMDCAAVIYANLSLPFWLCDRFVGECGRAQMPVYVFSSPDCIVLLFSARVVGSNSSVQASSTI